VQHQGLRACVAIQVGLFCCVAVAQLPTAIPDRVQEVEADWLLQEKDSRPVTTRDDALSAVDGVKDGGWAFHTGQDNPPWWHVDLGRPHELSHALIYNRCDGAAGRMSRIIVLLSDDGEDWRQVYQHNGETFYGATDGKPLRVDLKGQAARFLRTQVDGPAFLHLDEVEVYGSAEPEKNLALWADADQSSISQWSSRSERPGPGDGPGYMLEEVLERGRRLTAHLRKAGVETRGCRGVLDAVSAALPTARTSEARGELWRRAHWAIRELSFSNPLLDFDDLLFVKRVPSSFSHMSDQYYGWWSRPGGGIYILKGLGGDTPTTHCLTSAMPEGSFLRPDLSYDGRKILFAYCKFYPNVRGIRNKETKVEIPEDAFYHVFEMNVDGTGLRQLTRGRYDDFDARYLPNGEILFLSTRRGQFLRTGRHSAMATLNTTLPDCYVRCGGDAYRPVAVYTLHVMDADGGDIRGISPFENFEWTPSVTHDGRIIYARWDYIDRHNMPYMGLWSVNPDGTNPRSVYGNFTHSPHCTFEARCIPGSDRIIFTASAHHAITGGSIALLDPMAEFDGKDPITRLTPGVPFPELEGWPTTYYANPYPLSEEHYLVAWSPVPINGQGSQPAADALGLYLLDAFGNQELIYRDPEISSMYPIPLRARQRPPSIAGAVDWEEPEGRFLLLDVYKGLEGVGRGDIKRLRIVGVPPKTQPVMNSPNLGATRDDPGKYVLGTVPVAEDGSAYFRVPAGTSVFFQALDEDGYAVQTMRTVTCAQPSQTLSCAGCHEPRQLTPVNKRPDATAADPSKIKVGPEGSWPLRYDRLVQPVLDKHCVKCHSPEGKDAHAAKFDLTPGKSYQSLVNWGNPSLAQHVRQRYNEGRSVIGGCGARLSPLLSMLRDPQEPHHGVRLQPGDIDRLVTWMDTYGQVRGAFSDDQERRLLQLRADIANLLQE